MESFFHVEARQRLRDVRTQGPFVEVVKNAAGSRPVSSNEDVTGARAVPAAARYFFPMAIIRSCVRSSSRPSEIAGVASTGVDISFIASTW